MRTLYNAMIDKRPALIARCVDVADVIAAVNLAREHDLPLAIRGGGHNGAGLGSVDGGLVVDLSPMDGIYVDPVARTARVEGGCTWGGVDHDPANAARITGWARDYWTALHPYSAGGAYVNMMMEEGQDRIRAAYRDNYDRLAAIKATYDPANLFRVNQNIRPASAA